MNNVIVTYETFHGSAKKIAQVIAGRLGCKCINIDTPFEAEDLSKTDTLILVFNFRGPYTAQLTKLYLSRVKEQVRKKNVILVGEGLFSQKEFPIVAQEIYDTTPSKTFHTFFVTGQLRVETLFPEAQALLKKFSELTGMEIKDMGQLDLEGAEKVAGEIEELLQTAEFQAVSPEEEVKSDTKWVCEVCGYVHTGETPPEKCPLCGVPKDRFYRQ